VGTRTGAGAILFRLSRYRMADEAAVAANQPTDRVQRPVPGDRPARFDHVEGVRGVGRVGQRLDDVRELHRRAGPAVRRQRRHGARVGRARVQEVDAQAVDLGAEPRNGVEPRLGGPPVVGGAPVLAQLPRVRQGHPPRPVVHGPRPGPAGPGRPLAEVGEVRPGHLGAEGSDGRSRATCLLSAAVYRIADRLGTASRPPVEPGADAGGSSAFPARLQTRLPASPRTDEKGPTMTTPTTEAEPEGLDAPFP
jgi:hypothetical protein